MGNPWQSQKSLPGCVEAHNSQDLCKMHYGNVWETVPQLILECTRVEGGCCRLLSHPGSASRGTSPVADTICSVKVENAIFKNF